ncbi:MAG: hypothetical protein WDW38_000332 [Sanguina aurantia]
MCASLRFAVPYTSKSSPHLNIAPYAFDPRQHWSVNRATSPPSGGGVAQPPASPQTTPTGCPPPSATVPL